MKAKALLSRASKDKNNVSYACSTGYLCVEQLPCSSAFILFWLRALLIELKDQHRSNQRIYYSGVDPTDLQIYSYIDQAL